MTLAGQIGLVPHPVAFWPRAIAWVTRSTVFHTVLAFDDVRCLSAEPGGAVVRSVTAWPDVIWSRFELTDEQLDDIVDWGIAHWGVPYGFFTDVAVALALLLGWSTPRWVARYLSTDQVMNCSQLCDSAYLAAGIHLFDDGRLPSAVYPGSFVPLFKERGWMR